MKESKITKYLIMRKNKIDLYLYIITLLHNNFNKNQQFF